LSLGCGIPSRGLLHGIVNQLPNLVAGAKSKHNGCDYCKKQPCESAAQRAQPCTHAHCDRRMSSPAAIKSYTKRATCDYSEAE